MLVASRRVCQLELVASCADLFAGVQDENASRPIREAFDRCEKDYCGDVAAFAMRSATAPGLDS